MPSRNPLLLPFQLNALFTLKNRIVMAPMTRVSANQYKATNAMAEYYARRASAGLIISEGTVISENARGADGVPGIFDEQQVKAWQAVTARVHESGGLIFQQIWHVGRVSHPEFLNGDLPISASATEMSGHVPRSADLNFGMSRAATTAEINELICQYADAAENAVKAGFDGVEIHGANGYLIDQFLHHDTNKRQDAYGGSPQNMARFALEVVEACGERIGFERLAIRLSPGAYLNQIEGHIDDAKVFACLLAQLSQYSLAYVHTGSFDDGSVYPELGNQTMTAFMRQHYDGVLIACGSYSIESACSGVENNAFDLVAIGRPFIANPDFIDKVQNKTHLKPYNASMLAELV